MRHSRLPGRRPRPKNLTMMRAVRRRSGTHSFHLPVNFKLGFTAHLKASLRFSFPDSLQCQMPKKCRHCWNLVGRIGGGNTFTGTVVALLPSCFLWRRSWFSYNTSLRARQSWALIVKSKRRLAAAANLNLTARLETHLTCWDPQTCIQPTQQHQFRRLHLRVLRVC